MNIPQPSAPHNGNPGEPWRVLAVFDLPSEPGNERLAMQKVAAAIGDVGLTEIRLERLKTAVAEAALNAIEHGNKFRQDLPVHVKVLLSASALEVHISDQGADESGPEESTPDLQAKLAGLQSPRGWGLFLIRNMVDELRITSSDTSHTVELVLNLDAAESDTPGA